MKFAKRTVYFSSVVTAVLLLFSVKYPETALAATALTTQLVANSLSSPVLVTSAPGDHDRLFIVEKTGKIRIVKNGVLLATPFLDISSLVVSDGEEGLLGLAFHPNYDVNGYFYVYYTNLSENSRVSRFSVTGNPDIADPNSEFNLLAVNQPFTNHNGGMLAFSPNDGYMYIGFGDGGSADDPFNNGQDSTTVLGKILRIDVDSGSPYGIPPDNPFVGTAAILDEIWAFGVRNPWRYSFDRETGDMYIGDVGQNVWEEVDFQPASSGGGENYGWRLMEGNHCHNPPTDCDPGGLVYPIHEYSHSEGCSITGGYVYRGCAVPDLRGTYFFADYCSATIWSFKYDGANLTDFTDRTAELDPPGVATISQISSFGEDASGELYIIDLGGEVYKIVPVDTVDCNSNGNPDGCDIAANPSLDLNSNGVLDACESTICGDADASGSVDIDDVVFLITYIFAGGPAPSPLSSGDCNCSGAIDIDDVVYEITYIFAGGPAPCDPDGNGTPDCG